MLTQEEISWIEEHPVVYFGYDPYWPPYEMYVNGKYTGICADFIKAISKRSGINFVPLKNSTWEKSFRMLKNNQLMMVPGAAITEERKKKLIYTDNYIKLPWVIVTKKTDNNYKTLDDLNNHRISLPKDYMQQEILRKDFPKIKIITRNNFQECLQDVSTGVSVATVGSLGTLTFFMNETGSNDLQIANYTRYNKDSVAFAFPKDQIILRNIVQKSLNSISMMERNKINSKWITINFDKESNNDNLVRYFLITLVISIGVFVIVFIWIKSLKKQIDLRKQIEIELSETLLKVNKQNSDKTVLLQEIHHRVKNNLQIIISLLRLQSNNHPSREVKSALNEAIERINSISLVHEHIYKNPNLAEIDLKNYIQNLGEELKRVFIKDKAIDFEINTNNVQLSIKTIIPIALILNELITNSLKYAFRNKSEGTISIQINLYNKDIQMLYADNGDWFENKYIKNFGTYLIEIFTEQLSGSLIKEDKNHASYIFEFKEE
jgi:two-component sensor histidine kinase